MAYSNGNWPNSALSSIGDGYSLSKDGAHYYNLMKEEAKYLYGHDLHVNAGYRSYQRQVELWNLYLSGKGNLAAKPGYSNHGNAAAIDLRTQADRAILDRIGAKYGFSKSWSDAQSEWWHIVFDRNRVDKHAIAKVQSKIHKAKLRTELGKRRQQYYHGKLKPGARHWVARRIRAIKKALGAK